jgi:hypothetical protein
MLIEISQAFSSVKAITDLASLLSKTRTDSAVVQKAIDLQSIIISLQSSLTIIQSEYQALLAEKDDLKKQVMELENWQTESSNHALQEITSGVFVYTKKIHQDSSEPMPWLCVNCYDKKHKSILQYKEITVNGTIYICHNCGKEIVDHQNKKKSTYSLV